jgi:hypothetical protein
LAGSCLTITSCFSVQQSETIVTFRRSAAQLSTSSKAVDLSVGDSAIVEVWARLRANHTKIRVKRGSKYRFVVPPGQIWTDWFIPTDANGYARGPIPFIQEAFASTKVLPHKNWFLLTGAVGCPEHQPFPIGANPVGMPVGTPVEKEMRSSGELILFANDARSFYWNNFGRIQVIVTRAL